MSRTWALGGVALSAALLFLGYALASQWAGAASVLALGLLGAVGHWRTWERLSAAGFLALAAMAACGVALDLGMVWMLGGLGAALCAWELGSWSHRLAAAQVLRQKEMERRHLRRLLVVVGLGSALAGLTALVRLPLGFFWALTLGLVAALALARAISYLRESH